MEHGEPGQVGNQAALSRPFHVSDSIPADDFSSSGESLSTTDVNNEP